jgi:hypothetical protein
MNQGDRRARIELQLRIGALFIADRHRAIARCEREGRDSRHDRDMLSILEAGRQTLLDVRQRLQPEGDIPARPRALLAA